MTYAKTVEDRFWAKVLKTETCWLWQGALAGGEYPNMGFEGRTVYAHRWSYERFVGPIPDGLQIDHVCGVKACVNPQHLRPLTNRANTLAHYREQRDTCRNGHALTDDNVVLRLGGMRRDCRTCERARRNRWQQKAREEGRR